MQKINRNNYIFLILFNIYIFLNGFVFKEPAPVDYLALFIIFVSFFLLKINLSNKSLIFTSFLILSSLISSLFSFIFYGLINVRFLLIDLYLFTFFLVLINTFNQFDIKIDDFIFLWLISVIVNLFFCILAKIGFLSPNIFNSDLLKFGRFTGFFKDPNVFGPFVMVPFLYYFYKFIKNINLLDFFIILFLFLGILLIMSRAVFLSVFLTFILIIFLNKYGFYKKYIMIFAFLSLVFFFIYFYISFYLSYYKNLKIDPNSATTLEILFTRFTLQSYDTERFKSWHNFFNMININPLSGIGSGNYENFSHLSAHQTYMRLLGEKGLFFGLMSILILLYPLYLSFKKKDILVFSLIFALLINSFFIDSLHWRFLYVILALPFSNNVNRNNY